MAAAHSVEAAAQLEPPPLPDVVAPVWEWFAEISARRGAGAFGPAPIAWAELEAWERRNAMRLKPHEVEWIFALDRLALEHQAPAKDAATKGKS